MLGALAAGFLVSGHYETATLGERLDATVERGEDAARGLVDGLAQFGEQLARSGSEGWGHAASAITDIGITTSIKTALAADPSLSALKIGVRTERGVVTLTGPAPSAAARDRAAVLAKAPEGVREVRNALSLPAAAAVASAAAP